MSVVPSSLRTRARSAAEPVARMFGRVGLTPNALTVIGFGIAVVGAILAAAELWLVAGLVVAVGSIFDLFDGALARATDRTSRLGAFLDSTFDRAGEAVVYLGVAFAFFRLDVHLAAYLAMVAMAAAFMVSYVRAKSESLGFTPGSGMANVGLAPREVRTVILVIGLLAAGLIPPPHPIECLIAPCPQPLGQGVIALTFAIAAIAILATITTIQRIYHVYQQAKKEP